MLAEAGVVETDQIVVGRAILVAQQSRQRATARRGRCDAHIHGERSALLGTHDRAIGPGQLIGVAVHVGGTRDDSAF